MMRMKRRLKKALFRKENLLNLLVELRLLVPILTKGREHLNL